MKWIYYFDNKWDKNGQDYYRRVYFRPIKTAENGKLMTSYMIIIDVFAVEKMMEQRQKIALSEKESKELLDVYFDKLKDKDYHFTKKWKPKGHEHYLLCGGSLFLKVKGFNKADLLHWIKVFLQIEGMPCDSLEETERSSFSDETHK